MDPRGGLQVVELRTERAAVEPLHRALREATARVVSA
jgi:hypothetical protein